MKKRYLLVSLLVIMSLTSAWTSEQIIAPPTGALGFNFGQTIQQCRANIERMGGLHSTPYNTNSRLDSELMGYNLTLGDTAIFSVKLKFYKNELYMINYFIKQDANSVMQTFRLADQNLSSVYGKPAIMKRTPEDLDEQGQLEGISKRLGTIENKWQFGDSANGASISLLVAYSESEKSYFTTFIYLNHDIYYRFLRKI